MEKNHQHRKSKALDDLISLLEDQENNNLLDRIDIKSLLAEQITPTTSGILGTLNLKKKSNKFPSPNLNSNLKAFLAMTTREIQNLKQSPSSDNVSDREKKALEKLGNQHQLTMKPLDKGGTL